jgi:hypothetical protein
MREFSGLAYASQKKYRLVAIHQPNFFPWLGYFNKLARSDAFILLDNVQVPKTGGSWMNRVRILANGKAMWLTMPLVRSYHGVRRVNEMRINNDTPWRAKLLKSIRTSYGKAAFFDDVFPLLSLVVNNPTESLADYNSSAIHALAERLRLDTAKILRGSTLRVYGNATDLLISMVQAAGGTAYLSGDGAGGYQQDQKFADAEVALVYQNFCSPRYPQGQDEFMPGLSIIDCLMYCGFETTRSLLLEPEVRGEAQDAG